MNWGAVVGKGQVREFCALKIFSLSVSGVLDSLNYLPVKRAPVASPPPSRFRIKEFELDAATCELRMAGTLVKLQPQPFRVLLLLVERAGQLVTREEIQRYLWKDSTFVDFEHGINFSISQIRVALDDDAEKPQYVETLPRRGYRFIGAVEESKQATTSGPDRIENVLALNRGAESPAETTVRRRWLATAAWVALVGVFGVGAYFIVPRAPVLTEKDTLLLADCTNTTGDAVFDGTLRQGLEMQLQQSPFLNLVSENRVQQTLRLMSKPADARLTPEIARDLCQRVGSKAYIESSIANLGNDYVIGLKAVSCATGDLLAQEQVQALGKEKVLNGLSQAAVRMRGKLGESLSSVQKFDTPLAQATTPSLEALRALSLGKKALDNGDYPASVLSFQRAIALDPDFAMAYCGLSASYTDLGERSLAVANAKKAYELRERASELEKFGVESNYDWLVTGDLEKVREVYELFVQTYPRDSDAHFNLGNIYDNLGQYEKGLQQARESIRLEPTSGLNHAYLVYSYLALNRLSEARAAVKEALAKYPDLPPLRAELYVLAFLENDSTEMAQQVAWAAGKKGIDDALLGLEAATSAYSGRLAKAREQSRGAVASAEEAKERERAASHQANAAMHEALFGNRLEARLMAAAALQRSGGRDIQYVAALALALAADSAKSQSLADNLVRLFPEDTIVRLNYLPTLRAQLALNHKDGAKAIETLRVASPYELMTPANPTLALEMYPVFVRGQAYLETHQGSEAAAEFQKILEHRGIVNLESIGALAHLGLARAYALQGDTDKAKVAYQDFLTLWKNADPDIPVLIAARAEYAKLQ
jgi:DNA-binding winged helix-turn-helix (wHTH) protein/predicted Zn-dependent protease